MYTGIQRTNYGRIQVESSNISGKNSRSVVVIDVSWARTISLTEALLPTFTRCNFGNALGVTSSLVKIGGEAEKRSRTQWPRS